MSGASAATVELVFALLLDAPKAMTAPEVAAALLRSMNNVKEALRQLREGKRIRIAGHDLHRGPRAAGRPAPRYDTLVELGDVEFVPLTASQIGARCRARRNADPVRAERYREDERRRDEIRRERNKPTPRPAFDPKTAINWKRVA